MKLFFPNIFNPDRLRQILIFVAVLGGIAVNIIANNLFPLHGVPISVGCSNDGRQLGDRDLHH